ncbi:MAG: biotin/lipoyl-binding protein [Chloroflexota bacterium]|nr:biotin/lipoyl-binding protein [Chloroflexota bacterium]
MAEIADRSFEYDDLLDSGASPWRRRLLIGAVALIVAAVAAFFAWNQWVRGGSAAAPPVFTQATVTTGNVTKTISTSGTVSAAATANLSFTAQSEKVTKVNVVVGQAVKAGDVLAQIDPTDAQNALKTAQASLASAQANLQQTLAGSTAPQLAAADQGVVQAQTSYNNAVNALQTLQQPPTAAALEADQQAVTAAQAQLQTAQQAQADLTTNAQTALRTAQLNLQAAQAALTSAQQAVTNASENQTLAQATLAGAESAYCANPDPANIPSFCTVQSMPIPISDATMMVTVSGGANATAAKLAQTVLTSDSGYRSALTAAQTASNALTTAQNNVTTATTALATAQAQPTQAQVTAAASAVSAAQSALATANANLATLQAGPTAAQLASAQGAVDQAAASLKAAQASRDQTYAGSTSAQIQSARTAVVQAQVNVANAQKGVADTKLVAPFDGTVAALNIQVGDLTGASSASGSAPAIVLNTPNRLVLNLTIAETDYPSVKVGDTGTVTFSALTGEIFPFVIDGLGANPTTTQGVVTYQATGHLVTGPQAAQILGSLSSFAGRARNRQAGAAAGTPTASTTPRAATTPAASATPAANATPGATRRFGGGFVRALANQQQPAPGMSATATIIVDQRTNVIMVPSKAVQTKNRQSFVTVKNANGTTQDVTVTTGLTDGTNTEITSGLTDGQTIEIPGTVTTTTTTTQALPATGGFGGFRRAGPGG